MLISNKLHSFRNFLLQTYIKICDFYACHIRKKQFFRGNIAIIQAIPKSYCSCCHWLSCADFQGRFFFRFFPWKLFWIVESTWKSAIRHFLPPQTVWKVSARVEKSVPHYRGDNEFSILTGGTFTFKTVSPYRCICKAHVFFKNDFFKWTHCLKCSLRWKNLQTNNSKQLPSFRKTLIKP